MCILSVSALSLAPPADTEPVAASQWLLTVHCRGRDVLIGTVFNEGSLDLPRALVCSGRAEIQWQVPFPDKW